MPLPLTLVVEIMKMKISSPSILWLIRQRASISHSEMSPYCRKYKRRARYSRCYATGN